MSPIDVARSIAMTDDAEFDAWLTAHGARENEVVVAIFKRASGRQTVTLAALQETALCHGWVDTQTKRIDEERYAIRFVPRRSDSTWGPKNRRAARRLLAAGRVRSAGLASLPRDL